MTIRMLKPWNGYQPDQILSFSTAEETRLVGLGLADYDLDGAADALELVKARRTLTGGIDSVLASGQSMMIGNGLVQGRRNRIIKQFSDLFGVTISTTNATVVSTIDPDSPFGCPALKLVCTFTSTGGRVEVTPPATNIPAFNGHVAYTVWLDDATKFGQAAVFIGNTGYAKYQQASHNIFSGGDLISGHRVIYGGPIRKSNITDGGFVFGTDTFQATKFRVTGFSGAGGPATVWIRDCFIPSPQKPIVCFTWDDGFDTWVTKVSPMLKQAGIKATFGVNTANIDNGSGISSANLQSLISDGHQVTCHNINNYKLQTLFGTGNGENNGSGTSQSVSAYLGDYHTARAVLEAAGVNPSNFMYHPYVQGGVDQGLAEGICNAGVDLGRTTSPYEAQLYGFEMGNNVLSLRSVNLDSSRTLAQAKAMIDDARLFGGLCIFMGHQTHDTTAGAVTWITSDLADLISYSASSGAEHMTMTQLRDRFAQMNVLKTRVAYSMPMPVRCIGRLIGANMNSTADQAIALDPGQWKIEGVYSTKPSVSLTTAAGGVYTSTAKGGTAIVAAAQSYSTLVAATDVLPATMAATPTVSGNVYLSLTTAQGSAATADLFVFGRPI